MNWLFYIGGWFVGWALFNSIIPGDDSKLGNAILLAKLIAFTSLWIWFCWKCI